MRAIATPARRCRGRSEVAASARRAWCHGAAACRGKCAKRPVTFSSIKRGDRIELVDMPALGDCLGECRTVQRACEAAMEDGIFDVVELLYKGGQRAAVTTLLCREASNVCRRKPPKVPKSRAPEPAFTELSAEAKSERDVLKMLKNMEAEGMPGMSMYGTRGTHWRRSTVALTVRARRL